MADTAAPMSMEHFVRKQAMADAIVNIVLTAGVNYPLTRLLPFVPGSLPFGDTNPSLGGTLVAISVLMSVFLTLIVYTLTVAQRKAGKILPALPTTARAGFAPWALVLKHLALTLIPAIVVSMILHTTAPNLRLPPLLFVAIATVIAATAAWFMSQSTTRATLKLG